ncbi:MAG TPA: histidinol-phosphate transaminase [Syntrophales bacterium]|nr:histidinol-phosphate transaminase [Syntrophales bacterium]HPQ43281.1 histidinol-phosphate transaminase [Syntrophales bacterium]
MDIEKIIKNTVRAQEAYAVEETSCRIKLDANENPYPLTSGLKRMISERLETVSLNRYPEPGSPGLRADFARYYGVDNEMILIGNGSDELIHMLLTAVSTSPSGSVMFPTPTFAMYRIGALNTGHTTIEVPLHSRLDLDIETMLSAISNNQPSLIFISYPNNPTGRCFDRDGIEKILEASNGLVVIDEAYANFSGKTFLPDLERWDNLVILRTLSKVGLAALRLGILIGHPLLVHQLNKVRLPYNVNIFSQIIGSLFVEHSEEFLVMTEKIIADRTWLFQELSAIDGIDPYPSDANFILFSCVMEKDDIYRALIDRGVLVKNFTSSDILKNCMRVTVGTDEENREFIEALKLVMQGE